MDFKPFNVFFSLSIAKLIGMAISSFTRTRMAGGEPALQKNLSGATKINKWNVKEAKEVGIVKSIETFLTFDKTVYILGRERYLLALSVHTMTVYYVYCVSPNLHCKTIRVIAEVRAPETRSSFTKYQSSFFLTLRRLDTALADDELRFKYSWNALEFFFFFARSLDLVLVFFSLENFPYFSRSASQKCGPIDNETRSF